MAVPVECVVGNPTAGVRHSSTFMTPTVSALQISDLSRRGLRGNRNIVCCRVKSSDNLSLKTCMVHGGSVLQYTSKVVSRISKEVVKASQNLLSCVAPD